MLNEHEKSEMRTQYRDAADKRKQIGILSELYDCSKEEVLDALGLTEKDASAGANTKHRTAGAKRNPRKSYEQAVKNDVAKAVLVEGLSASQAAEKFGVPLGNVSRWVRKAKATQAEFLKEAEKTEKECAAKAALPALKKAGVSTAENKIAQKVLTEMRTGIDGLHAFIDNFAGVKILNDDERAMLDRILFTASGFAEGVQTGLELARRD